MASPQPLRLLFLLLAAASAAAAGGGTLFNFTSFTPNTPGVNYSGDAFASGDNIIELTRNQIGDLRESSGHAVYARPIHLWDPAAAAPVDFTTNFRFRISILNESNYGDGLAFFLAPVGYSLPPNSFGGWLGLFNSTTDRRNSTQLVAVEFDTYRNEQWDFTSNHVGIDINSIFSKRTLSYNKDSNIHSVTVCYNSTSANLSVFLSDNQNLSHNVNLTEILPRTVVMGFSGATGNSTELHQIISWDFSSTFNYGEPENYYKKSKSWMLGVGISVVTIISGAAWLLRRRCRRSGDSEDVIIDQSMEDKLVQGTGFPKKYTYKQLETATHAFGVEGKLGQGGFGAVYMGYVDGEMVAVKRISRGSSQGKKEYVSEVTVISRLRHRNLVRLTGWCHERSEFLLVYEYMENGSLDSYLFGEKKVALKWGLRYRIARGLAAALLYLHEEWEQCVVHRDVKASNVMLDAGFNARLGDFGLARMVEHGMGSQTTVLAGTMGYLAPECVISGRASKESDVYSFGVVALEIACGRRAVEPAAAREEVGLVEWAWGMYGRGRVGEAADGRLAGEFVEGEMERMVAVGLWCVHPDSKARPTMREAIQVMTMQAPVPRLPAEVPRPMYFSPPMDAERLLMEASGSFTTATGSNSSGTTLLK